MSLEVTKKHYRNRKNNRARGHNGPFACYPSSYVVQSRQPSHRTGNSICEKWLWHTGLAVVGVSFCEVLWGWDFELIWQNKVRIFRSQRIVSFALLMLDWRIWHQPDFGPRIPPWSVVIGTRIHCRETYSHNNNKAEIGLPFGMLFFTSLLLLPRCVLPWLGAYFCLTVKYSIICTERRPHVVVSAAVSHAGLGVCPRFLYSSLREMKNEGRAW